MDLVLDYAIEYADVIRNAIAQNKKIVLYPYGRNGRELARFFRKIWGVDLILVDNFACECIDWKTFIYEYSDYRYLIIINTDNEVLNDQMYYQAIRSGVKKDDLLVLSQKSNIDWTSKDDIDKCNIDFEYKKTVSKWFNDNGDYTKRLDYQLDENSIVIDAGGYKGDWTADIIYKYNCFSYIFEPVHEFAERLKYRFKHNCKVKVLECGLGAKTTQVSMRICRDGSSVYNIRKDEPTDIVQYKAIDEFMLENKLFNVQLIKINIEGGEYDLLEKICSNGMIKMFDNLQIQFHNIPSINATSRMIRIWDILNDTHKLTWSYRPFVWENWERID